MAGFMQGCNQRAETRRVPNKLAGTTSKVVLASGYAQEDVLTVRSYYRTQGRSTHFQRWLTHYPIAHSPQPVQPFSLLWDL